MNSILHRWHCAYTNAEALPDSDPDKRVAVEVLEVMALEMICGFESGES